MTKVEEIARAIYHGTPRNKPFEQMAAPHRRYWEKRALAALKAMREPSENMIDFGACAEGQDHDPFEDGKIAKDVWRLMIDAAIAEHEGRE